jgi:hypothetical protein
MQRASAIWMTTAAAVVVGLCVAACGAGVHEERGDEPTVGKVIGTLTGVIDYEGDAIGHRLVVGLMDEWPMTKPPVRFWEIDDFDGKFPAPFEFDLDEYIEGKAYYFAAFLDTDPDDVPIMMNSDVDPMDLPKRDSVPYTIHDGLNVHDFVLLDPDQCDFWWTEDN